MIRHSRTKQTASSPASPCGTTRAAGASRSRCAIDHATPLVNLKESSMHPILRNERGMALAVAIIALVIVGALVAGALFAGTQEQRVGDSSRRLEESFGVAELGVNSVVRTWKADTYNLRGVYPTDSVLLPNTLATGATPRGTGSFGGYVYR